MLVLVRPKHVGKPLKVPVISWLLLVMQPHIFIGWCPGVTLNMLWGIHTTPIEQHLYPKTCRYRALVIEAKDGLYKGSESDSGVITFRNNPPPKKKNMLCAWPQHPPHPLFFWIPFCLVHPCLFNSLFRCCCISDLYENHKEENDNLMQILFYEKFCYVCTYCENSRLCLFCFFYHMNFIVFPAGIFLGILFVWLQTRENYWYVYFSGITEALMELWLSMM